MRQSVILLFVCLFFLTSCETTKRMNRKGVKRINTITLSDNRVPATFNGFTILFVSDLHLNSMLTEQGLKKVLSQIEAQNADLILLGGDYVEGKENLLLLMKDLSLLNPPYGVVGVLGNNDYEQVYPLVKDIAGEHHMVILEDSMMVVERQGEHLNLYGVGNPFKRRTDSELPTFPQGKGEYTIVVAHTPDFFANHPHLEYNLALSGHTHGGQITFFGLFAPRTGSNYGQKFRAGKKKAPNNEPIIITKGVGTSQRPYRFCASSEIVKIILNRTEESVGRVK